MERIRFVNCNEGSVEAIVVWDTFKAYIRSTLIAVKAHYVQNKNEQRSLHEKIEGLDSKHKENSSSEVYNKMKQAMDAVKILDARSIAKDIIYAKQLLFEYRAIPRKQLVIISADSSQYTIGNMKNQNREIIVYPEGKLVLFTCFLKALYLL